MPFCEICKYRKTKWFYEINRYIYYHCTHCRTLFLYPKPNLIQISNYYSKNFKYTAGEANEKIIRARAKIILNNLKKLNPVGKSLFDVGSGYGYFLEEAKSSGLKILGIEPSNQLYNVSINRLIDTILHSDFNRFYLKNSHKKFDFITIIHTIEHVENPREMIIKAINLLNSGGILYIETPNLDSHLFKAEKYDYTFLTPPDHIWLFSQKSFHYMLRKVSEVQVEKNSTYSYPEHFMGIAKKLAGKLETRSAELDNNKIPNLNKNITLRTSDIKLPTSHFARLKYTLFDQLLAPLLTPILNLGNKGSILELYISKI